MHYLYQGTPRQIGNQQVRLAVAAPTDDTDPVPFLELENACGQWGRCSDFLPGPVYAAQWQLPPAGRQLLADEAPAVAYETGAPVEISPTVFILPARDRAHRVTVGWRNDLQTYFATVTTGAGDVADDNVLLSAGRVRGQYLDVDPVLALVEPFAVTAGCAELFEERRIEMPSYRGCWR